MMGTEARSWKPIYLILLFFYSHLFLFFNVVDNKKITKNAKNEKFYICRTLKPEFIFQYMNYLISICIFD